jgi:sterol desaturase/sphingolipid hydroxylase (fatty acid hydroxylase superfamily)
MIGDMLPVSFGPLILGPHCHMFTLFSWFAIRNFETHEAHSGYDFPWSPFYLLPLSTGQDYHQYHHSENCGNYSTWFSLWDTVLGSNAEFYEYAADKAAKESKVKAE